MGLACGLDRGQGGKAVRMRPRYFTQVADE